MRNQWLLFETSVPPVACSPTCHLSMACCESIIRLSTVLLSVTLIRSALSKNEKQTMAVNIFSITDNFLQPWFASRIMLIIGVCV